MKKINYTDYLGLKSLLSCQKPISFELGRPAHDEMLFITVHQSYEIWFKQLLFELESVLEEFNKIPVKESLMNRLVSRLDRMVLILKNLILQVDILETMTPLDFLEFRDLLYPASGFQSYQFRLLENRIGLKTSQRITYNDLPYYSQLQPHEAELVQKAEKNLTLFKAIEGWLERTPFLKNEDFDFWSHYKKSVQDLFKYEYEQLETNNYLSIEEKDEKRKIMLQSEALFESLFNKDEFEKQKASGLWQLSMPSLLAALLIQVYRDEPIFHLPFRLLTSIQDLDAVLTQWRYRHALLAQRMLGRRIGTGGSSGSEYLKKTADEHRVFMDLTRLTTFFIPRSKMPDLPIALQKRLAFAYQTTT